MSNPIPVDKSFYEEYTETQKITDLAEVCESVIHIHNCSKSGKYKPRDTKVQTATFDLVQYIKSNKDCSADDVWNNRVEILQSKGWTWGPQHDTDKKQTPYYVPFKQLEQGMRDMFILQIKLIKVILSNISL